MGDQGPIGRIADVFVFGPLGLAVEARSRWPEFAARGRRTIQEAIDALEGLGLTSGSEAPPEAAPEAPPARTARPDLAPAPSAPGPESAPGPDTAAGPDTADVVQEQIPVVDVVTLAIPDYDSLSASQVVPRLDGLAVAELEQVRLYELGNRGRKTILNKIAQLEAG